MSDQSRRKLLKSIAAGSGAIVAGKSLPESWSRPVVDSVMLPVHAQTSPQCEQNPLSLSARLEWEEDGDADVVTLEIDPGFDGANGPADVDVPLGNFEGTLEASGGICANGSPVTQDGTFSGTLNTGTGAVSGIFTHRILCGGNVICTASGNFSGTAVLNSFESMALTSVVSECCPDSTVVFPTASLQLP